MDAHGKLIAEGIIGKNISGNTSSGSTTENNASYIEWYVQSGAFANKGKAQERVDVLKAAGFEAIVKPFK